MSGLVAIIPLHATFNNGEVCEFRFMPTMNSDVLTVTWPSASGIAIIPPDIGELMFNRGYARQLTDDELLEFNEAVDVYLAAFAAGNESDPGLQPLPEVVPTAALPVTIEPPVSTAPASPLTAPPTSGEASEATPVAPETEPASTPAPVATTPEPEPVNPLAALFSAKTDSANPKAKKK